MADEEAKNEKTEETPTSEAEAEATEAAETEAPPPIAVEVTVQDAGACKKKVSITIPREEIDKKFDDSFAEIQKTANIRGFRPGRAPRRLVEKRFRDDVEPEVKTALITEGFRQAIEKEKLDVIGEPELDPEKIELPADGPLVFELEMEVRPEVKLPTYVGIDLEVPKKQVTDEDVEKTLENIRHMHGRFEKVGASSKAKKDDDVLADITIKVDDKAVVEQKDAHIPVAPVAIEGIGIEKMTDVLEGAKAGETKSEKFKIADDCRREELRSKEAELTVVVKEIHRRKPAELDEEFFKKLAVADLEELKKGVRRQLEADAEQQYHQDQQVAMSKFLLDNTPLELPEELLKRQSESSLSRQLMDLQLRGVPVDVIEKNMEQLKSASAEQTSREMKLFFILDEIAEAEKIEATDQEVDARLRYLAARYGRRQDHLEEELRRRGQLATLRVKVREDKVRQFLLEKAKVSVAAEAEVKAEDAKDTAAEDAEHKHRRKPPKITKGKQEPEQDEELQTT